MNPFFQFEADFVESLRCIPMQVRFKLDTCGVKLKLNQWNQFDQTDRQQLVDRPCESDDDIAVYRIFLHQMIRERTGTEATDLEIDPAPPWSKATTIPDSVLAKVTEVGATLSISQWAGLTPLQRFALIKLSRSNHENHNFLPALQEFDLVN